VKKRPTGYSRKIKIINTGGIMRLSPKQIAQIKKFTAMVFGEEAKVYLFGSRLDDNAKGGDIDLLVEADKVIERPAVLSSKLAAKIMIANHGLKIDVILLAPNLEQQKIHDVALATGVRLWQ